MKTIRIALSHRLSSDSLDARLGQLACYAGAAASVPISVVALLRHPGSRAELDFGLVLACLVALLLVLLGMVCRLNLESRDRLSVWSRWPEFASYIACTGVLFMGIRWIAGLGLTPAQITNGLLMTCALSLAVLVLGMTTTPVRSPRA